ncbi:MAG: YitT family protein [Deltaproteobacteria bacterium]|nr:YitT family protein [Deltaproteobacteria bacterium]
MKKKLLLEGIDMKAIWRVIQNLGLITIGSVLCAVAINGILIPLSFLNAGFSGLALAIHYMFPFLQVSWLYFILNIPLFAIGWKYVGRRFFLYSLAGMIIFSGAIEWTHISIVVRDKILGALLAGIISGVGSGIILRSLGSAGGVDILAVIMLKRFSIRLGTTSLAFNSLLMVLGAGLFSVDVALYTLIYVFVTSYAVNFVVTGLSQRKAILIISQHWDKISREIMSNLNRGVTVIKGQGGYSGKEEHILYTVISFRELPRLKRLIHRLDPVAFVVVNDTLEVMGNRIGTQPHW